jgi:hypothetical protein
MSVAKFRFVSPGVFINEIDNSQLPRTPAEMGPVIIGRSLRGPVMRPVMVQSFQDFVEVFGEPVAGGIGGDVWRNGNRTAPTYGAYAAQAYLRNSSPVTFIRLAGYENPDEVTNGAGDGAAGWKFNNAYGLFYMPISESAPNIFVTSGSASATLAAVVYSSGSNLGLTGTPLSGASETVIGQLGTWVRAGTNLEVKITHLNNYGSATTSSVNFDENSKKYIRSVLNTNPTLTNTVTVENEERILLGETYKSWVETNNSGSIAGNFAAVLVKLATGSVDFGNFKQEAQKASSGWIFSQHKGATGSWVPNGSGEYPVQKLFRLHGLSEGEWNSQNLKISIEDIKEPPNQFVKFGTFSVSVRKIDDTDINPQYVERFTGLTLDPSAESFIAKKIGDKYSEWDYEKKAFVEYGTYDNKSKFIRVEMVPEVETGETDTDLLPYGFYGPKVYTANAVSGGNGSNVSAFSFINTALTGNNNYTASFLLPEIPLLTSSADSIVPSLNSIYWGFKTNVLKTKKHNKDIVDYVRALPAGYVGSAYQFVFSLDDVSGSISGSTIVASTASTWVQGNRATGASITSQASTGSDGSSLLLSKFNKFTVPMVGGFDGVDIVEKDPFNRRVLDGKSEITSYAYNSIKVAVESVSDPEVVEMNLAAIPGVDNEALTGLLIEKCESRGDALAVVDLKGDYVPEEGKDGFATTAAQRKPNVDTVVANLKDRALNSSYGCSFFPWVLIRDELNNNTVWVPPSVAALGTFSSSQRRTEVWFAPAGFNRGGLTDGAAGLPVVQTALRLSSKDRDKLYEANINPIATFPAEGIVIFGQKTLQVTPSALDRINVRRLMIFLKKEISRFATTVLFDPNVQVTWKRFTNLVVPFLDGVKSRFGLSDFRVILDETTTTPDLVDRNIVYAKILLKPTRAIEFIALDFVITNTGASFND